MNALSLLNQPGIFIEIGPTSLKAINGDAGIELPLDRTPDGRLTEGCRGRLTEALPPFVNRKSWQTRTRAYCGIGARGVSLRRMLLPPSSKEELRRVLSLQIESEFPLSPDELAWGYRPLNGLAQGSTGSQQSVLVAAVKKEVVDEYTELFSACGLAPIFTLAALARGYVCPNPGAAFAMLDIGREQSEWMTFEDGAPGSVRVLPWGRETFLRLLSERLGASRDETEKLMAQFDSLAGEPRQSVLNAMSAALDSLAGAINGRRDLRWLYLTGEPCGPREFTACLSERLGISCERVEIPPGEGRSAAVLGLQKWVGQSGGSLPLTLQVKSANGGSMLTRPKPTRWLKIAAALAAAALLLPFAEATVMKRFLSTRMSQINAKTNTLAAIDSDFSFLQYLNKNQSPYLDALYLLSKSAPGGSKFDSITMNRRGEISLRGSMRTGDQAGEFRSKLIDSGFFSTVVLEEQTPTPDRQKVNVRFSALWKQDARPSLKVETPPKDTTPGMPGGMPAGMPPGFTPAGMPAGMPAGAMPAGALPPGVRLPPGVTLPPGVELPPGMVLPEGSTPPGARGRPRTPSGPQPVDQ